MDCNEYLAAFEPCIIADKLKSEAYEAMAAPERALIKEHIARLYSIFGGQLKKGEFSFDYESFFLQQKTSSCPFVFYFLPARKTSYQSLISALMPAIIARVADIRLFFIEDLKGEEKELEINLLTSLDLMGLDMAYQITEENISALTQSLSRLFAACHNSSTASPETANTGRLIFFGKKEKVESILLSAAKNYLPSLVLSPDEKVLHSGLSPEFFLNSSFAFAGAN